MAKHCQFMFASFSNHETQQGAEALGLIGEKLIAFADAARDHPTFARELPKFLAAIWQVFNEYEIAGYVASRRPIGRQRLRQLLYFR